ncbi:MAG: hypothetical protein ACXQTW_03865 [Candidatus Methanospirareceae archaeon]
MKFRFKRIETVEDILEAIGRTDIPSSRVTMKRSVIDEKTGEVIADLEIEIPDEFSLSDTDEQKLVDLMQTLGMKLKEKK